jgi:hypothetical protein
MAVNKMNPLRKLLAGLILAGAFACSTIAQPVVTAVVNKASYSAVVSPNCWVIIAGYNFASSSVTAQSGSLPTALAGVTATVAGLAAPLLSVSPNEIDVLIPAQTPIPQNTVVPLVVTSGLGASLITSGSRVTLRRSSPIQTPAKPWYSTPTSGRSTRLGRRIR